jgi:RNA polymerase sigma factor (sigma-70 family)
MPEDRAVPTGIDFPVSLEYIGPVESAEMENPEFDYEALVRPLEPRMMRSIWRIVREKPAAEDALQDALAIIWKKRAVVARHPNPQALILRIAVSAALDALRKSRRRLHREIPGVSVEQAADASEPAGKEAENRDLRAAILRAISRLPKRQAAAMLLRIVEEQSYEEIARAMDCSEATIRIHVMRGKAALARNLAGLRPGPAARDDQH